MEGHVIKRGKNYSIVYDIGRDPVTGKRKQKWETVKGTKKDADRVLRERLRSIDMGTYVKPTKITVGEYLKQWIENYQSNLAPRSFDRYSGIIRRQLIPDPSIGGKLLTQLRPENIQKHYTAKLKEGLSANTVRYHHAVLHVALETALKWGLLFRNPADAVTPPRKHRTEMQTWDEDEILYYLESVKGTHYYALFHLALFTAMRRSELLALRWCDVDLLLCQVHVSRGLHQLEDGSYIFTEPKTAKSRRSVALPPPTIRVLEEHRELKRLERALMGIKLTDNELVFSKPDGENLRPNTVTNAWKRLVERAGLKPIRLHDARHTHATILFKENIHPKIVQERLGHSSIQITLDTYSHVAPGLQEAAADRFGELFDRNPENEVTTKFG